MAYNKRKVITVEDLEEGDLIEFYRAMGTFSHWAVYIGNGEVIHFSPDPDASGKFNFIDIKQGTSVRKDSIRSVAGGSNIYRNNEFDDDLQPYSKAQIVKRAKERLGKRGYDLQDNNCEHFATECRYGQARSKQVDGVVQKAFDWITPSAYRAWMRKDWTEFLSPPAKMLLDKCISYPSGDLVQL